MPPSTSIRAVMAATTALMALPGVAAALNDVRYVFEVSDQSPLFTYTPDYNDTSAMPDPANGWAVDYTGSAGGWKPNSQGSGTSAHTTSLLSAQVQFPFVGTGVAFLGTMDTGALSLAVDDNIIRGQPEGGSLFSASGLSPGRHMARITRNPELRVFTPVSITGARVTTSISSEASSFDRVRNTDLLAVNGGNASPEFSGWSTVQNGYLCSRDSGSVLQISVPADTAFLELWVPSGLEGGTFSVIFDPAPLGGGDSVYSSSFNFWETAPEIAYFTNLDPTAKYTVQITNRGPKLVCLQKAKVYFSTGESTTAAQTAATSTLGPNASGAATNAAGSTTAANGANAVSGSGDGAGSGSGSGGGKKSNAGPIAGGVVGGVAALAVILALILFLRRRKRNARSRQQAMYKATSRTRDRPGSWQPFFGTGTLDTQGSRASKDLELIPGSFAGDKSSRHTSMQTYDSTAGSAPMTPPVGEFGTPILPLDEVSKFTPAPYNHFAGSHSSIPSQSSLPPISEMPRPIPPGHSFATVNTMGAAAGAAASLGTSRRSALTSPSSDTVDSLPPGWPSPPTSPPRLGPRPPPRKHMSRGSLSPPTSPTHAMQPFASPGHILDS
ncbi:hypothetical protein CspeluHIS016_0211250 [Cutaneotrichosporon spelunceum]|uniref:Uncharacterized protein n=1 Tax=Cutaneotrichosporon spelunceum TaxID=1672016 RepID=A0AAD3TSN2_9TREE|nr:hypothetical protein CspeluHIS016_0211250 [Cutaneotrichosporon spelunceum]